MTLFRDESMTGVLRPSKQKTGVKRSRGEPYRVFDYQDVPISVTSIPCDFTPFQQPCSSPASTALQRSREKPQSRHKSRNRAAQLRMEELLCIKKELTVIKSQIDGLLDNLERMDPQSQESSGRGVAYSPLHGSVSSVDGSSGDTPPLKTDEETQSPQTADSSDEDRQHIVNSQTRCFKKYYSKARRWKTGNTGEGAFPHHLSSAEIKLNMNAELKDFRIY